MQRQLWVNAALVALALGTFGLVWATRDAPTTSELSARKNQLFPELTLAKVEALTLSKGKETLELRRQGGEFQIVKPWSERADIATLNKWLTAADMATVERPADGVDDQRAGFGPDAFHASIDAGGQRVTLTLGGAAPTPTGARYAKVESDGRALTCVVRGSVAAELEVPLDSFRETRLLEYGKSELARIVLDSELGHAELEQREHGLFFVQVGSAWELAGPLATSLTGQLAQLSTETFTDAARARAALPKNATRVQLELRDRAVPKVILSLGGVCPADSERTLLVREQAGRSARAGCVARSVEANLKAGAEALRLRAPFTAHVSEVEELRVVRGEQRLELARKDKAFVLRAPGNSDVPLDVGNQRISAILGVSGDPAPSDTVGSGDGEIRIQVAGSDETSHREERILLGKPRPDKSLCFKRVLDGVTRCVAEDGARTFEPDARLLKSLSLLGFAPSELSSLSVETPDFKQHIVRSANGSYELHEPKGFAHDAALLADVVQSLGTLETSRWVAGDERAIPAGERWARVDGRPGFGLGERARVRIALTTEPAARELDIGVRTEGGYYARLSPDPSVFVLDTKLASLLQAPLIDRTLCPFDATELAQVEVRRGARRELVELDAPLREALGALRAAEVAHLGARRASEGFAVPRLEIGFVSRGGKRLRLLVGDCRSITGDAPPHAAGSELPRCYVRRDDVDATFVLGVEMSESLRKLMRE